MGTNGLAAKLNGNLWGITIQGTHDAGLGTKQESRFIFCLYFQRIGNGCCKTVSQQNTEEGTHQAAPT